MTLAQFISTYTGQAVDVDGVAADTGQCVQLVALYCEKVLNVPYPNANAKDWWNNAVVEQHFNQISVGQPILPGDIVVWGASSLINSPEFGHIDICVAPTSGGFTGFDSNWGGVTAPNGYPAAHEVQHNFSDVLGYLRIRSTNIMPTDTQIDQWISTQYQIAFGASPSDAIFTDWRSVLKNNFVDGSLSILAGIDTNAGALKNKTSASLNKTNVEAYIQEHLS